MAHETNPTSSPWRRTTNEEKRRQMANEEKIGEGEGTGVGGTEKPEKAAGGMSEREAGRKGGEKGGQTTKERYGTPFYKEIGRKGGETVRNERGHEFYEEIGRKGGQKVRDLINAGKQSNQK